MAADYFGFLGNTTAKQFGNAASGVAGAVSDFYAAAGAAASADQYFGEREELITKADLARQQTALQQYSSARKIESTKGAALAAIGASGFQQRGSALDILRESTQQGHLTQAVIGQQGAVQEAGYLDAAKAAEAEGAAAHHQIFGDILGGVLKLGQTALSFAGG